MPIVLTGKSDWRILRNLILFSQLNALQIYGLANIMEYVIASASQRLGELNDKSDQTGTLLLSASRSNLMLS